MNKKYVVYTITLQGKVMYVGKCSNFTSRKWYHTNYRGTHYSAIPVEVDLSLLSFDKISEFTDELEALKEEDRLIVEYDTINNGWNKLRSGHIRIDNNTEYQRIHSQMYRDNNREKVNAYTRKRYEELMKDPAFREKERIRLREYRKRKKETA